MSTSLTVKLKCTGKAKDATRDQHQRTKGANFSATGTANFENSQKQCAHKQAQENLSQSALDIKDITTYHDHTQLEHYS